MHRCRRIILLIRIVRPLDLTAPLCPVLVALGQATQGLFVFVSAVLQAVLLSQLVVHKATLLFRRYMRCVIG